MALNWLQDYLDLASEQQWRAIPHGVGGFKLYPPRAKVRPGYEVVFIARPHDSNPRVQDEVRSKLKRAGLQFPEPKRREETVTVTPNAKVHPVQATAAAAPIDDFVLLGIEVEKATTALSNIEQIAERIRARVGKADQLRELLKGFAE